MPVQVRQQIQGIEEKPSFYRMVRRQQQTRAVATGDRMGAGVESGADGFVGSRLIAEDAVRQHVSVKIQVHHPVAKPPRSRLAAKRYSPAGPCN